MLFLWLRRVRVYMHPDLKATSEGHLSDCSELLRKLPRLEQNHTLQRLPGVAAARCKTHHI